MVKTLVDISFISLDKLRNSKEQQPKFDGSGMKWWEPARYSDKKISVVLKY